MRATWFLVLGTAIVAAILSAVVFWLIDDPNVRATYISAIVGFSGVIVTLLSQSLIQEYSERRNRKKNQAAIHGLILGNCRQLGEVLPRLLADLNAGNAISIPRNQTAFVLGSIKQNITDLDTDELCAGYIELAHFVENIGFMILSSPTLANKRAVQIHDNFFIITPAARDQAKSVFGEILNVAGQLKESAEVRRSVVIQPRSLGPDGAA